ncbi:hypothetical protein L1O48_05610 [Ligilactobacillus equi]|uniref:hypothetical protein n=1 Tax=Ligilactobacillus equi TaxID=137357 RepID=UPI002ED25042
MRKFKVRIIVHNPHQIDRGHAIPYQPDDYLSVDWKKENLITYRMLANTSSMGEVKEENLVEYAIPRIAPRLSDDALRALGAAFGNMIGMSYRGYRQSFLDERNPLQRDFAHKTYEAYDEITK